MNDRLCFHTLIPTLHMTSLTTSTPATVSPVPANSSHSNAQRRFAPFIMLHSATAAETERSRLLHFCANLPSSRLHIGREICKDCKTVNQNNGAMPHHHQCYPSSPSSVSTFYFALSTLIVSVNSSRSMTDANGKCQRHIVPVLSPLLMPASRIPAGTG